MILGWLLHGGMKRKKSIRGKGRPIAKANQSEFQAV
jgi:hypothetical protein